ncbi:MAG: tetratricopeptide repeat protein, partial [Candidatus Eisenbacteria bacterium]|nr:tetratricopeptide repeat protein [Candidatus Eisenbacteria bacterium]
MMSVLGRLFHRDGMSDYRRGIVHFNNGDFDRAVEAFERTLESIQNPSDPYYSLGRFYAAEAHSKLGLSLYQRGDLIRAAAEFRKALSCGYRYPDLHMHLASILDRQGDAKGAEQHHRAALEIHPDYHDARCGLLIALLRQSRPEEAAIELARLREAGFPLPHGAAGAERDLSDPAFAEGLRDQLEQRQRSRWGLLKAVESYDRGDKGQAIADLREAIAGQPRYADLRCRLGSLLIEAGAIDEALSELEVALEINPRYVEARLQAGLACLRLGQPARAIEHLRVAASEQPAFPDVHLFLALAVLREGDLGTAAGLLEKTLEEAPRFHRARYALGLVRLAQGRGEEALRFLRAAVDGDPLLSRARIDLG